MIDDKIIFISDQNDINILDLYFKDMYWIWYKIRINENKY